jgi:hypothetical protein
MKRGFLLSLSAGVACVAMLFQAGAALAAATWIITPTPNPGTFPSLQSVAVSSAGDAWAVGYFANSTNSSYFSLAEHWNGSTWSQVSAPSPFGNVSILESVADLSSTNAWAVGYSEDDSNYYNPIYQPLIEHWNGSSWSVSRAASDPNGSADQLFGVAGVSASDVWAVGYHFDAAIGGFDGLVEHWNGSAWQVFPSLPSPYGLASVTAISSSDVWAAGATGSDQGLLAHWDGKSWTVVASPTIANSSASLEKVVASASNDVWAVGYQRANARRSPYQTLTEHWNGSSWSVVPSPNPGTTSNLLLGAAALSPTDAWAVGYEYTAGGALELLFHWDGTSWTSVPAPVPGGTTFTELVSAAGLRSGSVWAIGRAEYGELAIHTTNG